MGTQQPQQPTHPTTLKRTLRRGSGGGGGGGGGGNNAAATTTTTARFLLASSPVRLRGLLSCVMLLAGGALLASWSSCWTLQSVVGGLLHSGASKSRNSKTAGTDDTLPSFNASALPLHVHPLLNLHAHYRSTCGVPGTAPTAAQIFQQLSQSMAHPSISQYLDLARNHEENHTKKHSMPYTSAAGHTQGAALTVGPLTALQQCTYSLLDEWWDLTRHYNITNWSAHGGSAMGARCWGSLNPWDDDVDVSVWNCSNTLDKLWNEGRNVTEVYPDLDYNEYHVDRPNQIFEPKLIGNKWILLKGGRCCNWYKLKTVEQCQNKLKAGNDISGMDIECMEKPTYENEVRRKAGWDDHMASGQPLDTVTFGPTTIQLVPQPLLDRYIEYRYGKADPCSYPFRSGQEPDLHGRQQSSMDLPQEDKVDSAPHSLAADSYPQQLQYWPDIRKHSLHWAMAHWYTTKRQRRLFQLLADRNQLHRNSDWNQFSASFRNVEVDNSISREADLAECSGTPAKRGDHSILRVATFDANRGTHWDQWVDLFRSHPALQGAHALVVRNLDVGMARSGNAHTARLLAIELGMNYVYAPESLELSRGTDEEQNATRGLRDALSLKGNAVLSHCFLADPWAVVEPYVNALDLTATGERHAGGRGGLLVRLHAVAANRTSPTERIVVGTLPRPSSGSRASAATADEVRDYLGPRSPGAVVGGDFGVDACNGWSLWPVRHDRSTAFACGEGQRRPWFLGGGVRGPRLPSHAACSDRGADPRMRTVTVAPCRGNVTLSELAVSVIELAVPLVPVPRD